MSKRYYVSKVELIEGEDGLEARVVAAKYGTIAAQGIDIGPDGQPTQTWALAIIDAENHTLANSDPDCILLPAFALDSKVASMHTATKSAMLNRLNGFGIDTSVFNNADGFRDIVRKLGQANNSAFDENRGSWSL